MSREILAKKFWQEILANLSKFDMDRQIVSDFAGHRLEFAR